MKNRCLTEKVKTKFGSWYVHLEIDKQGRPCGLSFSTPGKILDSALDDVIRKMGEAADTLIKEVNPS